MSTSIFIKTWTNDIPWLRYCLHSVKMYGSGFKEIIVVADESCATAVSALLTTEELHVVEDWPNGYIQQQWVKINADRYTDADNILYVDSDCIFYTPFTPETFMCDGKPILLKTKYTELGNDDTSVVAQKWKQITSDVIGFDVEWEYMRRMPLMLLRSTLPRLRNYLPELETHMRSVEMHGFSEFNVIGSFIERFEPYNYSAINTVEQLPEAVASHFWSWGGITPEVRKQIERYLKV